ncbi:MAG: ribonuclease R family protein [Eubacteriales bacterium]
MSERTKHKEKFKHDFRKKKSAHRRRSHGKNGNETPARGTPALPQLPELVEGTFSYSGRGFGFCIPDGELPDIFLPPRMTMGAMTGDRVTVRVSRRNDQDRLEGEVVAVEFSCRSILGTLHRRRGYSYVVPDSKRFGVLIYIPETAAEPSAPSDLLKVEVRPYEEEFFTRTRSITVRGPADMPYFDTMGEIAVVFGSALSRDANYAAILSSYGIRTEFPEDVRTHADEAAREPVQTASENRRDLREKRILTIDGAGAKDLDDAISLERDGENWILGVHIADVSHYVRQDSPTEREARERGTSVYFTDKVVPMLPESLSNGACSLNAGTDKYTLTAEITLSPDGRRLGTKIYKSLIRSTVRGVYDEVNALFADGTASECYEKYRAVAPMLADMRELYEILARDSRERGVMELEDSEAVIVLDGSGKPVDVLRRERGDAERLIEQFMLQANYGVAETLHTLGLPCLYRIHEKPDREKMRSFAIFAHNLGLDVRGLLPEAEEGRGNRKKNRDKRDNGNSTSMEDLAALSAALMRLLDEANERGIGGIVSSVLLRSMMKAKYQAVCAPHFGLGAPVYCHFTSPIRRYPDLFVHTVITTVLEKTGLPYLDASDERCRTANVSCVGALAAAAPERGVSSSDAELRALTAERSIEDLYMALYMADRLGETFRVTVCSVVRSGMFVQCDNLIEGFLPAVCYPGAVVNDEFMTLTAGGVVYTLGTRLNAVLSDVDIATGRITFEPEPS